MKQFVIKRREQCLCVSCGSSTDGGYYCIACRDKRRDRARSIRQDNINRGLCIQCSKPSLEDHSRCKRCIVAASKRGRKLTSKAICNGLCAKCGKYHSLNPSSSFGKCTTCYLKDVSSRQLGSVSSWKLLLPILESQNYICPYSGETIILGQNDSIDHILPKSRFPDLAHDINNIQWVTRHANHMKWDMTHDEFIETLKRMYFNYFGV